MAAETLVIGPGFETARERGIVTALADIAGLTGPARESSLNP